MIPVVSTLFSNYPNIPPTLNPQTYNPNISPMGGSSPSPGCLGLCISAFGVELGNSTGEPCYIGFRFGFRLFRVLDVGFRAYKVEGIGFRFGFRV